MAKRSLNTYVKEDTHDNIKISDKLRRYRHELAHALHIPITCDTQPLHMWYTLPKRSNTNYTPNTMKFWILMVKKKLVKKNWHASPPLCNTTKREVKRSNDPNNGSSTVSLWVGKYCIGVQYLPTTTSLYISLLPTQGR